MPGYNRDKIDEKSKVIAVEIKKLITISSLYSKKSEVSESLENIAEKCNKPEEKMTQCQSPKIILEQNIQKSPNQIFIIAKEKLNEYQKGNRKRNELSEPHILKYNSPLDHMKNDR